MSFWDLVQQSQIGAVRGRARDVEGRTLTLEKRMLLMEDELRRTQDLLIKLIERLEERFGEDIDGDGGVGTVAHPGRGS